MIKRKPYLKRVLSYPKVFFQHYKIDRKRGRSIKRSLYVAFTLSKLVLRK